MWCKLRFFFLTLFVKEKLPFSRDPVFL